jgi:NADH-quinone oxidoreductase subunit M
MERVLWITVLLPLAGAVLAMLLGWSNAPAARWTALVASLTVLLLATWILGTYPGGEMVFAFSSLPWSGGPADVGVRLSLGLDGAGIWLFGLSSLLLVTAVLVSWESIADRPGLFYALLLILETGLLGVFTAQDIILFYVFFEFTLVPLFFLIGMWGSEERHWAAMKFFIFTLAGSVLTFLGLLVLVFWHARTCGNMTFSMIQLTADFADPAARMPLALQTWVFLALFAGFAIKVPLFPFHTWLPLAHVQAPTAGSVLLAGVLLKVGTYGFLRFNLGMLPEATAVCMPWVLSLAVVGILYGAWVCLGQQDIKRLIAYSSVSHLGYCMLGLLAVNRLGIQGGSLQMINHGISTGGLFACVGMLYDRYHTRRIADVGGLARRLPRLAFFMLLFALSSIGLPGLNGFAGEFVLLLGAFERAWTAVPADWMLLCRVLVVAAVGGIVLGAWYMLWLVQRVFFGPLREPLSQQDHARIGDLSLREVAALAPLAVLVVWIGLMPSTVLVPMSGTLDSIADRAGAAVAESWQRSGEVGFRQVAGISRDGVSLAGTGERRDDVMSGK